MCITNGMKVKMDLLGVLNSLLSVGVRILLPSCLSQLHTSHLLPQQVHFCLYVLQGCQSCLQELRLLCLGCTTGSTKKNAKTATCCANRCLMIGDLTCLAVNHWLPSERWMAFSIWHAGSRKLTPQAVCQKLTAIAAIVEYPISQCLYLSNYLSIHRPISLICYLIHVSIYQWQMKVGCSTSLAAGQLLQKAMLSACTV